MGTAGTPASASACHHSSLLLFEVTRQGFNPTAAFQALVLFHVHFSNTQGCSSLSLFAGHGGAAGAVMCVSRAPRSAPASHCRALLPPRPAQFCSPEQEKRAARSSSSNVPCCKIYCGTSQNILRAQDQWDVTARPCHTVWCLWGVPCSFQPPRSPV